MDEKFSIKTKEIEAIVELQKEDLAAGALMLFFISQTERVRGLVASVATISEIFDVTNPTIHKKLRLLESRNCITTINAHTSNIYYVNSFDEKSGQWKKADVNYNELMVKVLLSKEEKAIIDNKN